MRLAFLFFSPTPPFSWGSETVREKGGNVMRLSSVRGSFMR